MAGVMRCTASSSSTSLSTHPSSPGPLSSTASSTSSTKTTTTNDSMFDCQSLLMYLGTFSQLIVRFMITRSQFSEAGSRHDAPHNKMAETLDVETYGDTGHTLRHKEEATPARIPCTSTPTLQTHDQHQHNSSPHHDAPVFLMHHHIAPPILAGSTPCKSLVPTSPPPSPPPSSTSSSSSTLPSEDERDGHHACMRSLRNFFIRSLEIENFEIIDTLAQVTFTPQSSHHHWLMVRGCRGSMDRSCTPCIHQCPEVRCNKWRSKPLTAHSASRREETSLKRRTS